MEGILLSDSEFHNPSLKIEDDEKRKVIENTIHELILSRSKLEEIRRIFKDEMELGLESNPKKKPAIYMANSFVSDVPDGSKSGDYLGMDLGGTNLRIVKASLKPGEKPAFKVKYYKVGNRQTKEAEEGPGFQSSFAVIEKLFDYIAGCLQHFVTKEVDGAERLSLGISFSHGFDQIALDKGLFNCESPTTIYGTTLHGVIGKDILQYFRDAIARKKLNIDVVSISNDSTCSMATGSFLDKEASIALILGTSMNIAYYEKVSNIKKAKDGFKPNVNVVIINTECGRFGDNGDIDFAKSHFDFKVDRNDVDWVRGIYTFEKAVSSFFFGELNRLILLELAQDGALFCGKITEELKTQNILKAPDITAIENKDSNEPVFELLAKLGYSKSDATQQDIELIQHICKLTTIRNALLLSAVLSVVAERVDKKLIKVAVDGSFYKYHSKLHQLLTDFVNELVPEKEVVFFPAEDGSGLGSSLIAAIAEWHNFSKLK